MSWKDRLQQASFRDVPFKVADAETGIGRRNVLHQYPFKDEPYVEDLGADAAEFSVNAYILQNKENGFDYFNERDALISAIKEKGTGTLIHPFLGELTVAVLGKASVSESFAEGGIARFTITFVEAGENKFPQSPQSPVGAVDDVAEDGADITSDSFGSRFTLTNMPGFAQTQAITDITASFDMMKSSILAVKNTVTSTVSEALATLEASKTLLTSVVTSPCSLGALLVDSYDAFFGLVGLAGDLFTSYSTGACSGRQFLRLASAVKIDNTLGVSCVKSMVAINRFGELPSGEDTSPYGGQVEEIPVDNYIRAQEKANRIAYKNMIRANALMKAMQVAARIDYYSFEDSFDTMEMITEAADELLLDMGDYVDDILFTTFGLTVFDEETFNALTDAKSVFIKAMKQIGATFANVVDYEVGVGVLSTLELAYDLYEDLDRADRITLRNIPLVKHPGFLPNGQTVEVLSE